jgi:23S rRNA-/tRNA-specific pseudouridylate synthase
MLFCAATCLCSSANGMQQKLYNWNTLNSKVLKRLGLQLTKQHMQEIALCTPGAIEQALQVLKLKIANYQEPRCAQQLAETSRSKRVQQQRSCCSRSGRCSLLLCRLTGHCHQLRTEGWVLTVILMLA